MQITAIILAGGKSRRMGTDKALLELEGVSLLERSLALCESICDEIIISSNNTEHNNFGYPVFADELNNCGPLAGISSCLKKSETSWNFVMSVDAAYVEPDFVSFLISQVDSFDALVPFSEKGKEPLIALYNKSCLPAITDRLESGDFKMHNLLNSINTKWVDAHNWIEKYPKLFRNLNRPEDL